MAFSSSLPISISICSAHSLPSLPCISTSRASFSSSSSSSSNLFKRASLISGYTKISPVVVRAASSEDNSSDVSSQVEELVTDLKAKWDGIEDKPTILAYGIGSLLAFWLSAIIVSAVNSVPLLPKLMELFGLAYTGWFVYRYLIFEENRKELLSDIEYLKSKITGAEKEE